MNFRIFRNQLVMGLKLYSRMPAAIFWIFAFPVVMLLGMGTIFGSHPDQGPKIVWERGPATNPADEQLEKALADRGVTLDILPIPDAEARWHSGKLPALLEEVDGRYNLRINSYFSAQGMQIDALVQQAFLIAQARSRGGEPDRIAVVVSSPGGRRDGPYAAFLLPGLLGLNLLTMGVFSTGIVDVTMRQKGGYKRLATTPLPRHLYLGAQVSVRMIIVLLSSLLLILVGAAVFGIHSQGSVLGLFALLLLGAAMFISMGYVLASFAATVESYNGIANLVFLPMMLLSGVYFSLDAAPQWMQRGADLLPLAVLIKTLRALFNDGASLASQGSLVTVAAGWTFVLFLLAVRRFKWV